MSAAYARKSILARIDRTITDDSPKESDGKFLQEACIISDYNSAEFTYIKTRMENKYGFKFKNYYKRLDAVEQWEKERDPLSVKKSDTKSIENNINLKLQQPPSYEEVMKDTKKIKYKLCPFFMVS